MANEDLLEQILEKIRETRNFDFRNYKRATLRRRVERRMVERRCRTMKEYLALLEGGPAELDALLSGMLVKVTSFFRDPEAWDVLRTRVVPELLARKPPGEELRVWSVGCATGEETYSIAILIAEALGNAFQDAQVKVFGTDVDEAAIAFARRGVYSAAQVEGVGGERLSRWFTSGAEGHSLRKEIRRSVVFGVNNLVSDAPISRLDLLTCRNVFIYFDANLQRRILSRFHYALRPNGILLLGKSELIPFAAKIFTPIDLSKRVYVRGERASREVVTEERLTALVEQEDVSRAIRETRDELAAASRLDADIVNALASPVIRTSLDGVVTGWNAAAARLWGRAERDVIGKRLTALALPGLSGDLLVQKTAVVREGKDERATAEGVVATAEGPPRYLSIDVTLVQPASNAATLLYVVQDVTKARRVAEELRVARDEREKAIDELRTVNEELQSSNEELETTNEELQSANEELQTTNEELQSTNEELETTNEELQSTNEELDATNRELVARTEELDVLSFYQRTIIRSLSAAVIVLDPQGRITLWNLAAERLLGLTEGEAVGQLLWTLHVPVIGRGLVKQVRLKLSKQLAHREEDLTYERTGGTGHASLAAIPLVNEGRALGGVIIVEDTTRAVLLAEERVREALGTPAARPRKRPASPRVRARRDDGS